MVSPIKNIIQPIFPVIKTAKYFGIATYRTCSTIGLMEGIKFAKTNNLIEKPGSIYKAFNKVVPIWFYSLTGICLVPFYRFDKDSRSLSSCLIQT